MFIPKKQSKLSMWNSKQVLGSGLFCSIRLVTVSHYCNQEETDNAIQMQLKYLVKTANGLSEGFYTDFSTSVLDLRHCLLSMFDMSIENDPERANVYKKGKEDFETWVEFNSDTESTISPWMFTTIGI